MVFETTYIKFDPIPIWSRLSSRFRLLHFSEHVWGVGKSLYGPAHNPIWSWWSTAR